MSRNRGGPKSIYISDRLKELNRLLYFSLIFLTGSPSGADSPPSSARQETICYEQWQQRSNLQWCYFRGAECELYFVKFASWLTFPFCLSLTHTCQMPSFSASIPVLLAPCRSVEGMNMLWNPIIQGVCIIGGDEAVWGGQKEQEEMRWKDIQTIKTWKDCPSMCWMLSDCSHTA